VFSSVSAFDIAREWPGIESDDSSFVDETTKRPVLATGRFT
jgi:hypothetical protein